MSEKFKAVLYEFERGWGSRIDEIREFNTEKERDDFITSFNAQNNLPYVPDWYMVAEKG